MMGMDVHAEQITICRRIEGQLSQPAQRMSWEGAIEWIRRHVQAGAKVYSCYEAGPCGYGLHRQLAALGVTDYVVAPERLDRSGSRVKTDHRDAEQLCSRLNQYLGGDQHAFSVVRVPTPEEEQWRALCRHRDRLVRERQRCVVRACGLMLAQGVHAQKGWWHAGDWEEIRPTLAPWLCEQIEQWRTDALRLEEQARAVTKRIVGRSKTGPLIKGFGALTNATLESEIMDWGRFSGRRKAASFSGLCPSEHSTNRHRRQGSITRHGNPRVRHQLVEATWRLMCWQPHYKPLVKVRTAKGSRARRRAVVAAARHLMVDLWRIKSGQCTAEQLGLVLAE
ncbi:transposase IS116/IS110/IS902 family protein [mine drainage metagenome]|uniref:Transposase IS116/IS110/IS902 family protein n=1 Tax=mine drainage metagenome TaxID=410659 RepID=A0A1J5PA47_9ZZZZ